MKIGFHTDAFNSAYWSFEKCLQWAQRNQVHYIECGLIDGVSWIHGLGYQPHVAPVQQHSPFVEIAGARDYTHMSGPIDFTRPDAQMPR